MLLICRNKVTVHIQHVCPKMAMLQRTAPCRIFFVQLLPLTEPVAQFNLIPAVIQQKAWQLLAGAAPGGLPAAGTGAQAPPSLARTAALLLRSTRLCPGAA